MVALLSDNPSIENVIGTQAIAQVLSEVIRETQPPFALGVFGPWGSGKTTLMKQIEGRLTALPHTADAREIKSVWFNAWKYDGKDAIWNALIQTIFLAMKDSEKFQSEEFRVKLLDTAKRLAGFAARKATAFMPAGLLSADDVGEIAKAFSPLTAAEDDGDLEFINRFEDKFGELVNDYVGETGRLVVFIDDLDRCLPENAIEALEAIKLYLDSDKVAFVIGVERAVIEEAIKLRYRGNSRLSAKEYLEKIVQLQFSTRALEPEASVGLLTGAGAESWSSVDLLNDLVQMATSGNPRRLKRFHNSFLVAGAIAVAPGETLNSDDKLRLGVTLLLDLAFPAAFHGLQADPGFIEAFHSHTQHRADKDPDDAMLKAVWIDQTARAFLTKAISTAGFDWAAPAMTRWLRLAATVSE